jgi:hypothetical protein
MTISIKGSIENSSQWLVDIQNQVDGGWGEYKGADSNTLNTSEAIVALLETGFSEFAGGVVIHRGANYLIKEQIADSVGNNQGYCGSWARNVSKEGIIIHIPDTLRTSLAIIALKLAGGVQYSESIKKGIDWLIKNQNLDGGFGYTSGHQSELFPTCIALKTLLKVCFGNNADDLSLFHNSTPQKIAEIISNGFRYIDSCRNAEGYFGIKTGLMVSHTLHVIDVINTALKQGHPGPNNAQNSIKQAVEWIEQNNKDVLRWSTETVLIGEGDKSPYNYTFSHINPSLYLKTVFPIIVEKIGKNFSPDTALSRYVLEAIFDNIDDPSSNSHGFCANRPVSWATSNTITGLVMAKDTYLIYPEREIATSKPNERHYILIFLFFITLLGTILSFLDKLGAVQISFFLLVILSTLVVFGIISEKNYIGLIRNKYLLKKD